MSDRQDDEEKAGVDKRELDELFRRLYNKIHLLASRIQWKGANPTLNPTALVNEAYLKLSRDPQELGSKSYDEVIAIFANAMRQILVDATRRKNAKERLRADWPAKTDCSVEDAITLDTALGELERENPLQFRVVQCRFLLGRTVGEAAAALSLSNRTIEREWQKVRGLLRDRIQPSED